MTLMEMTVVVMTIDKDWWLMATMTTKLRMKTKTGTCRCLEAQT